MLNVLYVGPNESEWAQMNLPGSLAAAKWSRGFLSALSKLCNLTVLSHTYMYPWPKGRKIWVGDDNRFYPADWKCFSIQYPSLRYVRELWWNLAYPARACQIAGERKIDAAIFYNCHFPYLLNTMKALHNRGVPCFPIVLDGDDPRKDQWGWIKKAGRYSCGFVSLSWWVHTHCPLKIPKYHMDGGADGWRGFEDYRQTNHTGFHLVHTGALDQWRGFNIMVEVVKRMTHPGVKFVFCGKSSQTALETEFGDNPKVVLPGFLSEEKMREILRDADVLLNVRDPDHPDNILNYPSKLPHYLSVGRPIVSMRLESLSPDYDEVVEFSDRNTVDGFIQKLNDVLEWDDARKKDRHDTIKRWFERHKQWEVLVEGLYAWMERVIDSERLKK